MAKSNRATRKELETVVQEIINELQMLRQGFAALDNYLGAYVKFKGDSITFNDYIVAEVGKRKKETETKTSNLENRDVKSAKKERYKKISTTPL